VYKRRFRGEPDRLRSPERIGLLEVERVVALCLEGLTVQRVLDVGTGTGVFAEAFSTRIPVVAGVDSNPRLLAVARSHVPEVHFMLALAEAIPFARGTFDLTFLGHVLHETDNPLKALLEACRVAKGRVAVLEWPYREDPHGPRIEHRLRPETIHGLAGEAGCRRVERIELAHMDLYRLAP